MKIRLTGATFVAASKTITHASFSDITLAGIQLIVNVTDQIIIYNFADTAKGGTLATDTLTLEYNTTTMSDTDELMILVEDAVTGAIVQYADGAVRGTATGTIAMGDDGTNIQSISVDTEGKMKMEDMMKELLSRLSFLPSVRGIAADLRVTLLSGVVTTVTTVTNVSNLVNIGGQPAVQIVPNSQNTVAILSNINNIII